MAPLPRTFFDRPVLEVAPELLGCLVRSRSDAGDVVVRLTEVEAYDGSGHDPGSHAFRGRTARNAVMFGPPGHWYVYFTYGMHWCANIVCREEGWASAVLLRAGEVVEGAELAASRRPAARSARDLARGPARLASALGIDGTWGGLDATDPRGRLVLEPGPRVEAAVRGVDETTGEPLVRVGPRVGVGGAGADHPWRFWLDGDPSVSDYRPHARRRRASAADGRRSTGAGS